VNAPHFATLDGGSPVADLLDLIARRAPLLMRAGGGGLPTEQPHRFKCRGRPRRTDSLAAVARRIHSSHGN
jgi:hypothetical protein